jgi:hypothetical protein
MRHAEINVADYLQRFRLHPSEQPAPPPVEGEMALLVPEDLLELAMWYRHVRDRASMLGCVYLYIALRHPPPTDAPDMVVLGREVLEAWRANRRLN